MTTPEAEPRVRRPKAGRLHIAISIVALVLATASAGGVWLMWRNVKPAIDNLGWSAAVREDIASGNDVRPEVGKIQFLKNGFSIELEAVRYDASGLVLEGYIGNPTNIWVSNLTIDFHVKQPIFSARNKFVSSPLGSVERFFVSAEQIGSGQTRPIASLGPGSRERFEVAIPNVKQSKDGIDLRVAFSGERYSYRR